MMCNIIPFPHPPGSRVATGKPPASITCNYKHASAKLVTEAEASASTSPQYPTIFHMEVTIKLTSETTNAQ
jgi:hypothetical protein